ncbi:MAG: class I SAM-dependent RNA methyltransferase [Spirochaetes bacterium]|jgi:putative N6-adenine-specific DNA methylase|nr:class I SAM-dependent RNA methyltransferase [Spirochaetota bacterium]
MSQLTLIATCAFGLEAITVRELKNMGFTNLVTENGRIAFAGNYTDIARCNISLRTADRILLKIADFYAADFEELYQATRAIAWEDIIPQNGKMHIIGKSVKSSLHSVPACQSTVKKAIVEAMQRKYKLEKFPENGPVYKIEIALLKNRATLSIDTSGSGLHKRGYRTAAGDAPLRETLAAAMVLLSRWDITRPLADPLCGSGTIAIEAALIGKNIAPGLYRNFASEDWPQIPPTVWKSIRDEAQKAIIPTGDISIFASDHNRKVLRIAMENAERARVADCITFQGKPLQEFSTKKRLGVIITNPPYGERLLEKEEAELLYSEMGEVFSKLDNWSLFILTSHEKFCEKFKRRADKNRKLYNGMIRCYLYSFFSKENPLHKKKDEVSIETLPDK